MTVTLSKSQIETIVLPSLNEVLSLGVDQPLDGGTIEYIIEYVASSSFRRYNNEDD